MTNPIPLPRASLSFLVKQPGGLGCKLHSKCSKCAATDPRSKTPGTFTPPPPHTHTGRQLTDVAKGHTRVHVPYK